MNFFPDMMFPFGNERNGKTRPRNFTAKKKKRRQMTKESRKRNRTNGKKLYRR